jgi:hypothetical protein
LLVRKQGGLFLATALILSGCGSLGDGDALQSPAEAEADRGPTFEFSEFLADPLEDGESVSLERARAMADFGLLLPDHGMANADNVEQVWIEQRSGISDVVAIVFESSLVIIERLPQFPDSQETFEGIVQQLSESGARLDSVAGYPAFVSEPNSDPQEDNPGSLQFVHGDDNQLARDGVSVTLYGQNETGETLVSIAETIS